VVNILISPFIVISFLLVPSLLTAENPISSDQSLCVKKRKKCGKKRGENREKEKLCHKWAGGSQPSLQRTGAAVFAALLAVKENAVQR
jgi:hypothetical protein